MSYRYLSISQLSEVTGKDRRTVTKRLADVKPHSTNGRAILYSAPEAIETIFVSDSVEGMDKKLLRVQLALEEEKLQKIKIENGKSLGELVPVDEVAKAVEKEYSFVRSQIRAMPSKQAKPLSMVADPNEVYTRLQDAVDECLTELTMDVQYADAQAKLDAARSAAIEVEKANASSKSKTEPSAVGGPEEISESGEQLDTGPLED